MSLRAFGTSRENLKARQHSLLLLLKILLILVNICVIMQNDKEIMMDLNDGKMINLLYHKTRFKCFFSTRSYRLSVLCTMRCFLEINNTALT